MNFHKIPRHCLWRVQVWFAQIQQLHVSWELDDPLQISSFFTLFTQVKDSPRATVHEHTPIRFLDWKNPTCYYLSQMWSMCAEWCDPSCLHLHHKEVGNHSMDLLEVWALVSILPMVSPCCWCCMQHLDVRGVSKMNFTKSGLDFLSVVNRQMASGFTKLGCLGRQRPRTNKLSPTLAHCACFLGVSTLLRLAHWASLLIWGCHCQLWYPDGSHKSWECHLVDFFCFLTPLVRPSDRRRTAKSHVWRPWLWQSLYHEGKTGMSFYVAWARDNQSWEMRCAWYFWCGIAELLRGLGCVFSSWRIWSSFQALPAFRSSPLSTCENVWAVLLDPVFLFVSLEYEDDEFWEIVSPALPDDPDSPSTNLTVNGWSQSGRSCPRSPEAASASLRGLVQTMTPGTTIGTPFSDLQCVCFHPWLMWVIVFLPFVGIPIFFALFSLRGHRWWNVPTIKL